MKIQQLIDELSKISVKSPDKEVWMEVFDITKSTITVGYLYDIIINDSEMQCFSMNSQSKDCGCVQIRPIKMIGHNVYMKSNRTKQLEQIEDGLCPPKE